MNVSSDDMLRTLHRRNFHAFVRHFWKFISPFPLVDDWYVRVICLHLQLMVIDNDPRVRWASEGNNLLINLPPRTGKSKILSVLFIAWAWAVDPKLRFVTASYSKEFAGRDSKETRTLMETHEYRRLFPHTRLKSGQNLAHRYYTTAGGYRVTMSVESGTTGEGGDIQIFDDPHDISDSVSKRKRDYSIYYFKKIFFNRTETPTRARRIVCGQRVHAQDVSNELIQSTSPKWVHLCLPEEYDARISKVTPIFTDPRLKEGDLLRPDRFGRKEIEEAKGPHGLGARTYNAVHQQKPMDDEGMMFQRRWFDDRILTHFPADIFNWIRYQDLACFVPGTMVSTIRGDIPIELIKSGDMVLTRNGYRPVKWAGPTRMSSDLVRVTFSNGASLTGTSDHRVMTDDGWSSIGNLSCSCYGIGITSGDVLCRELTDFLTLKQLGSMGLRTVGVRGKGILKPRDGTRFLRSIVQTLCTGQSGGLTTEKYQTDTRYITGMETTTIIPSKILSASALGRMLDCTTISNTLTGLLEQKGTTGKSSGRYGRQLPTEAIRVKSVEKVSSRELLEICQSFAQKNAVEDLITDKGCIVFDLEVDGASEFFANGLLVHNCTEKDDKSPDPDWTASTLGGSNHQYPFVIGDVQRGRMEQPEIDRWTLQIAQMDALRFGRKIPTYIEAVAGFKAVVQHMIHTPMRGYPVFPMYITKGFDKRARAVTLQSCAEAGGVWMVTGKWIPDFLEELCTFGGYDEKGNEYSDYVTSHDDMVDSTTGCYNQVHFGSSGQLRASSSNNVNQGQAALLGQANQRKAALVRMAHGNH